MRDLAIKLRLSRLGVGMTQIEAGQRSGISSKSISSWESGARTDAIRVCDLLSLLEVYGQDLHSFLAWQVTDDERETAEWNSKRFGVSAFIEVRA